MRVVIVGFSPLHDFFLSKRFQTVEFNKQIRERYLKLDKCTMNIWDAFKMLEEIIDESDPDTDSPQIVHAFQTAEALRKKYPEHDWLHLAGFLHDLGKITAHPKFGNDPQWCVVGDTFPVGCKHSDSVCTRALSLSLPPLLTRYSACILSTLRKTPITIIPSTALNMAFTNQTAVLQN